jgi:GNAT superfamily N-acetyltransferase
MASALPDFPTVDTPVIHIETLSRLDLEPLYDLNRALFGEDRLINRYDHLDLIALMVTVDGIRAGFKIGYGKENGVFYSAKGGILPVYRRLGLARMLMHDMMLKAAELGYSTFRFDTLASKHREMLIFGLKHGFRITSTEWMAEESDYRIELSVSIPEYPSDTRSVIEVFQTENQAPG